MKRITLKLKPVTPRDVAIFGLLFLALGAFHVIDWLLPKDHS